MLCTYKDVYRCPCSLGPRPIRTMILPQRLSAFKLVWSSAFTRFLDRPANGMCAVTLANWAYGVPALAEDAAHRRSAIVKHLPVENLQVTIRAAQGTKQVRSCMLQRTLRFTESGDCITVELPRLDEGDVLLLKQ